MWLRLYSMLLIKTILLIGMTLTGGKGHAQPTDGGQEPIVIYVSKLKHILQVKRGDTVLEAYKCVLGGDPINDKKFEGDQCTPEGVFHIISKVPHRSWDVFMGIDYPTTDSWRKFERNKAMSKVPHNARIGGSIGIHGVPEGRSDLIDKNINWTLGCISLRNADVEKLYKLVDVGTEVIIIK